MGRFRRVSLIAGLFLLPVMLFAQFNNNTTSPYSRFGLGDLQPYSFGRTYAMGGASLGSRYNQQINLSNPASYNAIDSLGFMFEFGVNGKVTDYRTEISGMSSNDVNFKYFALNFQVTNKIGASLGLTPYSDVGYNVQINEDIENTGEVQHNYYGVGSLSKAYLGMAIEPLKNISIGANLHYLFGSLNRNAEIYFLEGNDFYSIQKNENLRLRDFGITLGLQATLPLDEEKSLNIGAILENKPKYTAFYSDLTQKNIASSNNSDLDTLNFQTEDENIIQMPLSYGVGISYVKQNVYEINADFYHQGWSKANFFGSPNPILTDLNKFAVGAEWIPEKFSIRSYIRRIAYRAGLKYEKSYLMIDNQQINDFGITFGVGLPIYRSNSTINVAAEIGRRGKRSGNLVLENYARLNLSVNLYDLWFIKRRFD